MSNIPSDLRYSKTHEWAKREGDKVRVGITDHAQEELGDVVAIYLPKAGITVEKGDKLAEIDSMKTSEVIYCPVSGRIEEVNDELDGSPEMINEDPYGKGWIVVISGSNLSELDALMDASGYGEHIKED